jgi:hypothetical protein
VQIHEHCDVAGISIFLAKKAPGRASRVSELRNSSKDISFPLHRQSRPEKEIDDSDHYLLLRDALVGSVTNTFFLGPPFSLYTTHASIVPKASCPLAYASETLGTFSIIHNSLPTEG